tara:strand:- start:3318 stop:4241 length:924 start_codon:yes stop_codon:yes gene_type:complete
VATRHTYASVDDLRDYLAGTSYSSNWSSDSAIMTRIVEASSVRIDNYMGMQSFGPRSETRYYDIGSGSLRKSTQNIRNSTGGNIIGPSSAMVNAVPLDSWLVSVTGTITSYKSTDRAESESLDEGYNNDYWLLPYNTSPKVEIELNEDTSKGFHGGQQTLAVTGVWGYSNDLSDEKTTTGTVGETVTAWGVNDASTLNTAQTIKVDNEQMYITGISSNTLTVERGVNGTTAATHTAGTSVYTYVYPTLVVQACLDLSKIYFRDRDLGVTQTIGTPEMGVTRSDREAINILKTLDTYRATTTESQVFF